MDPGELFERIVSNAPVALLIYREKFIYANPYALNILGYSLEELRSRYVWELVSEDFRDEVRETIRRRLRGEKIDREYTELPVYTKEGKLKIARFYATTVELEDGFAGLAVGTDVTKEKEKLELILTNSHDIVVVVDEEGIIRYKSPSVKRILGWEAGEVIGKSIAQFIHPSDLRRVERIREEVFQEPRQGFQG